MSSVSLETKMKPCSLTYWLQTWRVVGCEEAWLAHFKCDRQNLIPFKAFTLKGLPLSEHFHHEMIWNKSHRFVKHSIWCIRLLSVRIFCPLASGSIHFFFKFLWLHQLSESAVLNHFNIHLSVSCFNQPLSLWVIAFCPFPSSSSSLFFLSHRGINLFPNIMEPSGGRGLSLVRPGLIGQLDAVYDDKSGPGVTSAAAGEDWWDTGGLSIILDRWNAIGIWEICSQSGSRRARWGSQRCLGGVTGNQWRALKVNVLLENSLSSDG